MKRNFFAYVLLTLIINSKQFVFSQNRIENNSLSYILNLDESRNRIDVTFMYTPKQSTNKLEFKVPTNFNRVTLDTLIIAQNIRLKSKGKLIKNAFDSYQFEGLEETIEILYSIEYNTENNNYLPCESNDYFLPVITDDFFHFYSDKSLLLPDTSDSPMSLYNITVEWKNFPKHWQIANDIGIINKETEIKAQSAYNLTLGDIGQMLFFGGDYRKEIFQILDINFHTFVYGDYHFNDSDLKDFLEKVANTNLNLWKHFDKSRDYVISLTQKGKDCGKIGGRNMHNSFAIYMSGNFATEQLPLIFTKAFTHEFTHTWIGGNFISNNPEWEKMRWFVEGFCEYYAMLVNVKSGIITKENFTTLINDNYIKYLTSPYAQVDLDYYSKNYNYSSDLEKIAYTKGASFAFYLDGYIRTQSNSKFTLTDYIRHLIRSNKKINGTLDFELMNAFTNQYLKIDISVILKKHIENGEIFALNSPLIKSSKTKEITLMDYGFDFIESAKREIITGVKKNSMAYKGGLRNGQKLLSIKSLSNSVSDAIVLEVEYKNESFEVAYYPKGKQKEVKIIEKLITID